MFKKITSVVAAVAMTLAGLGALPASATGLTPNANSNITKRMWNSPLPVSGQFTIAADTNGFSMSKRWVFNGTKAADITSKAILVDWSLTKPDGSVIGSSSTNIAGFYVSARGTLNNSDGAYVYADATSGTSFNLAGANGVTYTGGSVTFNLGSSNVSSTTMPAGLYQFSITLKVDGTEYTDITTSGLNNAYVEDALLGIYGKYGLTGSQNAEFLGLDEFSVSSITCLDTSALSVGDVVTVRQTVDGNAAPAAANVNRYQSAKYLNGSQNRYLSFDWSGSEDFLTITQAMLDRGVTLDGSADFLDASGSNPNANANNSLAPGLHTFGISATKADGTEVTAGCFPEASPTPVATLSSTSVSVVSTGSIPSNSDYNYICRVYKASDNSLLMDNVYGSTGLYDPNTGSYTSVSCNNISGLPGGTAVYVKLFKVSTSYSGWATGSSASNTVTVPSSGVTFTTTPSNGTTFGAVKALTPIDQLSLAGLGTQFTSALAEPTGGLFEFTRKGTAIAVRHIKNNGVDNGFGTATHTSTAPSYTFGSGVHGTLTAPKPFVTMMTQGSTIDLVIKDWNYDGTTGNIRTVAAADISALCVSTFGATLSTATQMYAVSSPTADAYVQAKCSTSSGTYNEGWMLMKVAMTGTSAPTLVTKLGTGDVNFPRFNTQGDMSGPNGLPVSVNWTATGTTPVLTFLAVPMNWSCLGGPCVTSYGTSKFIRIAANGTVSAPVATGISSTVNSGENLSLSMGAVNFGTLIVNRFVTICSSGPCVNTRTVFKAGATGGATSVTPTWDTVAGWDNTESIIGTVLGSTADGQLVFIRSQKVSGTTSLKMAKLNLTTGAVTTFGETISYTQSGVPTNVTVATGGNSFMTIASSAVNAGKFDVLLAVGGGATAPVAPNVPVPGGDANTNLGLGLNAGGNKIAITGTRLTAVTGVTFNGVALPARKFVKTGTKITITVPAGTTGTVAVALVHAGGTIPVGNYEYIGATKVAQTIAFTTENSATYGDSVRELTATSTDSNSNALDVVIAFKSTTPAVCSVVDGDVRFLTGGNCVIVASQAGNAGVAAAAKVIQTIVVAKKAQVITIADTTLAITDTETVASGIALDSAEEMDLEYVVSNEDICTIDADGVISGVTEGTCVITVSQPGDARYLPATSGDGYTVTVDVTEAQTPPADMADADGDGSTPAASIGSGGVKNFVTTNDPAFQLAWDKASGKLIPRARGIYTGYIQAKLTFTKNGVTYTCTNVFGSNAAMKNKKASEKKAAKAVKTFATTAAFCTDAKTINPTVLTALLASGLTPANFAKIKPSAKATGAVATPGTKKYEAAAFAQLKNFTGTVSIEIKRFRAWPTTGVNVTGNKKNGKKIPATTRNTSVVLQ